MFALYKTHFNNSLYYSHGIINYKMADIIIIIHDLRIIPK